MILSLYVLLIFLQFGDQIDASFVIHHTSGKSNFCSFQQSCMHSHRQQQLHYHHHQQQRRRLDKLNAEITSGIISIGLTRELGKNKKLEKAIKEKFDSEKGNNIKAIELPCIEHADGPDYERLPTVLSSQSFDYITITSPEAARVLISIWSKVFTTTTTTASFQERQVPIVVAVGTATEQTLIDAGIPVGFVPSKATAKTLVQELPFIKNKKPKLVQVGSGSSGSDSETTNNNHDDIYCTTVLYPASARAENTLQNGLENDRRNNNDQKQENQQQHYFQVTRLNTYDTIAAQWNEQQKKDASDLQIITFASPSSVKGWLYNTNNNTNIIACCIGETSAAACEKLGWKKEHIYYPAKPGIDGWITSIENAIHTIKKINNSKQ